MLETQGWGLHWDRGRGCPTTPPPHQSSLPPPSRHLAPYAMGDLQIIDDEGEEEAGRAQQMLPRAQRGGGGRDRRQRWDGGEVTADRTGAGAEQPEPGLGRQRGGAAGGLLWAEG